MEKETSNKNLTDNLINTSNDEEDFKAAEYAAEMLKSYNFNKYLNV